MTRKPPFTVGDHVRVIGYNKFRAKGFSHNLDRYVGELTIITAVFRYNGRLRYYTLHSGRQFSWEPQDLKRTELPVSLPWGYRNLGLIGHPKFTLGDMVFLKDDLERKPRKITKISYKDIWTHKPTSDIVYTLDNEHGELHDESELITTKPITVF